MPAIPPPLALGCLIVVIVVAIAVRSFFSRVPAGTVPSGNLLKVNKFLRVMQIYQGIFTMSFAKYLVQVVRMMDIALIEIGHDIVMHVGRC